VNTEDCDVAVVGAGIHGAGVALAAAAAGYTVRILERSAVAAGTSSRSSKLIHGGLRYLETGALHLVYECLHERAALLRLAPELVRRVPFYLPVYRDGTRGPARIRAGLGLYALLAGLGPDARFAAVPRRAWGDLDGLDTRGLRAVFRYWDAQTDDAALTRAVLAAALRLGARAAIPAELTGAELDAAGCTLRYRTQDSERECRARVLVNAAGPWVNAVLERIRPAVPALPLTLVQGAHLILEGAPQRGVYYLESPRDHRGVFLMPWKGQALLGTTETPYSGDPDAVHALDAERDYLLETLCRRFPARGTVRDVPVRDAFAGLRVLPADRNDPFRRSRETRLHPDREARPRVLSIYGGKLTAFRATARAVLARIAPSLPQRRARADPDTVKLEPAPEPGREEAG